MNLRGLVLGATLLASSPSVVAEGADLSSLTQWGIAGVLVAVLIVDGRDRERRMRAEINDREKWIRDRLIAVIEENTRAFDRTAEASRFFKIR